MIKTVIIDDELKAIKSLKWELENFCPDVEIVASFTDPRKGLLYFKEAPEIDCIFLDIEMPQMDGFRFLDKIARKKLCRHNYYSI
jgi:two-component system LytT family response regulator